MDPILFIFHQVCNFNEIHIAATGDDLNSIWKKCAAASQQFHLEGSFQIVFHYHYVGYIRRGAFLKIQGIIFHYHYVGYIRRGAFLKIQGIIFHYTT